MGVYDPGTITANQLNATSGEAFSFSTSFLEGDALSTSAPTVGEVPNFSSVTSYSAVLQVTLQVRLVQMVPFQSQTWWCWIYRCRIQFVSEITVID